ncbi:insulinase family protein [Nodosilinea sp. LEGE 07088]|uniref:M16 family metallopeptidase n=1 Tax=Nodosilinea sp. LEGE 07088 TaxID=2777968 RepID=UPI001881958B|nr:pitrilysin family protein [Nodosilinea sp. LEGE 07088]MBE9138065.1 insulinase family protein [Nodosilinea sp. LEGE 07088]
MISVDFPASVIRLDNGLTLIHQEIAATPVVVADVWVRAGAIAEPAEWAGMAHFLEHMIFKGTDQLPPGVFDYAIETQGGMTNAATSHDYAHFYITIAADMLPHTLPYLADLLLHAAIPADEFDRERQVVLEEIRQAQDDPDWLGYQAMSELVYQDHPYGRPVLGTAEILQQRSPEEMRCFHQAHYQPDKMTVVITGGIPLEPTIAMVKHAFRGFASPPPCPPAAIAPVPNLPGVRRETLHLPRLEQSRLCMAWLGPGVDQLETAHGLDLLAAILAEGRSSRLVRELREDRQLVQDIGAGFSLQRDCSLFTIQAWLDGDAIDRVEAIVCDRLSELAAQPISDGEIARAKRLLCNDYAFSTEAPGQLAGLYGYYGTVATAEHCLAYVPTLQRYTDEQLRPLASQYLTPLRYVSTILRPA